MPMRALLLVLALAIPAWVQAQPFDSQSAGTEPLDARNCPTGVVPIQLPPTGVLDYTTVYVASNCYVYFTMNQRNTPVIIRAKGDVAIHGRIYLDANLQTPGPGGFYGGAPAQPGFGPGGGAPGVTGTWVGPLSLVPPIGGSGGGGGCPEYAGSWRASNGGGGGGAIVIASSTSITVTGGIYARGGSRSNCYNTGGAPSGPGSGGAIRLVANAVTVSGSLEATGGTDGLIRLEAPMEALVLTGQALPAAVLSTFNRDVIPTPTTAALSISSIGGFPVFSDAGVHPGAVDVVLPRDLTDPIGVVVSGERVPLGTQVKINISGSPGAAAVPATLTGTYASSTATLYVTGLDRSAETHLFVYATFDVPAGAALLNVTGANRVAKVRIEAAPGKASTTAFLREDGSIINPATLPAAFVSYFKD